MLKTPQLNFCSVYQPYEKGYRGIEYGLKTFSEEARKCKTHEITRDLSSNTDTNHLK